MSSSEERSVHRAQVVLYEVDELSGSSWAPLGDGQWAEFHVFHTPLPESLGAFRMVAWLPDTELVLLNINLTAQTEWALVREDFVEFETAGQSRKGMYFASAALAQDMDAMVLDTLASLRGEGPYGSHRPAEKDVEVASVEARESSLVNGVMRPPLHASSPDSISILPSNLTPEASPLSLREGTPPPERRNTGSSSKSSRRVSLALFEHVSAAVAEAASSGDMTGAVSKERERLRSRSDLSSLSRPGSASPSRRSRSPSPVPESPSQPPPPMDGRPAPLDLPPAVLSGAAATVRLSSLTPLHAKGRPIPENLRHQVHVTYNAELARYEGLPEDWSQLNVQFGVPFETLPKVDCGFPRKIPAVVVMMRRELQAGAGANVEGIFRLAPDKALCLAVKQRINAGTFESGEVRDVNILANLIKVWFRELPTCLFDVLQDEMILRIAALPQEAVATEMESFPEPMRSLTYWLCDTMADIVMNEKVNRMTAKNMAIVMSPNLFSVSANNPMFALTMSQKIADFTEKCLKAWLMTKRGYGDYQ